MTRRARGSTLIVVALVVLGVTGCSTLQHDLQSNLESRASLAKEAMAELLTSTSSATEAAEAIQDGSYMGYQEINITQWPEDEYATASLKYPTTAIWGARAHGNTLSVDYVMTTYATRGGLSNREEFGYACVELTGSTDTPDDITLVDVDCSEKITVIAFELQAPQDLVLLG